MMSLSRLLSFFALVFFFVSLCAKEMLVLGVKTDTWCTGRIPRVDTEFPIVNHLLSAMNLRTTGAYGRRREQSKKKREVKNKSALDYTLLYRPVQAKPRCR